jgi:hypothetical protein
MCVSKDVGRLDAAQRNLLKAFEGLEVATKRTPSQLTLYVTLEPERKFELIRIRVTDTEVEVTQCNWCWEINDYRWASIAERIRKSLAPIGYTVGTLSKPLPKKQ